jgi:alkyl sulfatase BDS1-like metallo-beta-lactamase superfamily hydrolase
VSLLELADRLWRGELSTTHHHPLAGADELVEVGDGTAFVSSFANVTAFSTGEGLVLVDSGSPMTAGAVHRHVRAWSGDRLHSAVYTHGHIDHVFGVPPFEEEARTRGWPAPRVVAHENVPRRFDRYVLTAGYNAAINRRQFRVPELTWPTEYRYPDETYSDRLVLEVGDERFELQHAKGETDDATWVWVPGRGVLCTGDLFIWATPNAGNPQKVQRYPKEWAEALRTMAGLGAEVLLPGHGWPILGADRVREALTGTADLLATIVGQTLELMNAGASLDEVIHAVRQPEDLMEKPYLRPVYDDPEFIVRNLWRQYGGWWDGSPATLKPAPEDEIAREIASLAGGAGRLSARAIELADRGELRLAGHLAEMAVRAAPDDEAVRSSRADVFRRRAEKEPSMMARSIFSAAATEEGER